MYAIVLLLMLLNLLRVGYLNKILLTADGYNTYASMLSVYACDLYPCILFCMFVYV